MEYNRVFQVSSCLKFRRLCPIDGLDPCQSFHIATPEWLADSSPPPDVPVIAPLYFLQQLTSHRKTWHVNHEMNHPKPEMSYLSREAKYHVVLYWIIHQFLATVIDRLDSKNRRCDTILKHKVTSLSGKLLL